MYRGKRALDVAAASLLLALAAPPLGLAALAVGLALGRPVLYGTTKKFLALFGLADLTHLPELDSLPDPGTARPTDAKI